jgi:Cytochrome P460
MGRVELDFHLPVQAKREVESRIHKCDGVPVLVATRLWWLAAPFFVVAGAAIVAACSSGNAADAGAPDTFVASAQSFDGFHSWSSAPAVAPNDAGDGLHGVGPLRVYWNASPPHGSTSFPVGTIVVKETEETDVTQRTVFAMVKRGGGFNSGGAVGWEWYSLQNNADGSVTPLWGSVVAPPGQTYANQAIGDCNGCHAQVADNDYVWDLALQLSSF